MCTMLFIDNSLIIADLEELSWVCSFASLLMLPVNNSSWQNQCKREGGGEVKLHLKNKSKDGQSNFIC